METRFSTDLIDALGKVAGGLKAIVNLPKTERETIRRTLDETYRLIDTTLNMVIIRLGDIQLHTSDDDFLREAARLNNYNEWMQAEREFRLCRSLHVALRETEALVGRQFGTVSTKDWEARYSRCIPFSLARLKFCRSSEGRFDNSPLLSAACVRAKGQFNPNEMRGPPFAEGSSPNSRSSRYCPFTKSCNPKEKRLPA